MKNTISKSTLLGVALASVISAGALLVGCSATSNFPTQGAFVPPPPPVQAQGQVFAQVEEFGRPAINEGLFITNDFLNAFNATLPANEGAALAGNKLLAGEAVGTLTALAALTSDQERVNDEVVAFIPDVQRIDTTIASPVGTAAYANGAAVVEGGKILAVPSGTTVAARKVPVFFLRAGRKLEDDVVDDTLTVLSNGAVTTDNIDYNDPDAGAAVHQKLNGQITGEASEADTSGLHGNNEGGAATFPFLAPPN